MKLHNRIYFSSSLAKKKDKIISKIKKNRIMKMYCLVLPSNSDNILDIYPYAELLQPYYKKRSANMVVVGVASNKDEAFQMVQDIITCMYFVTKQFNIEKYLDSME